MDNKDLQSRRDFFKKSLCTVLPIIGSIILGNPLLSSCSKDDEEDEMNGGSSGGGSSSCKGSCTANCRNIIVKATPIGHQHHAMALVKMRASQGAKHHV